MNGKVKISLTEREEGLAILVAKIISEDNLAYIWDEIEVQSEKLRENGKIRLWANVETPHNLIITPEVAVMMDELSSYAIAVACDMAYNEVEKTLGEHSYILTSQENDTWLEMAI